MTWLTDLRDRVFSGFSAADSAERAFIVGPSVVSQTDIAWGHDDTQFGPPEYLDYIATSNNVYACVTKRAQAISGLPLNLYRGQDKKTRKLVTTGPIRTLLDSVNPWMTFDRLLYLTEQYLCLSGEAFWFLERGKGGRGAPTEIWPVRPDWVRIVPDSKTFVRGFLLQPPNGGKPVPYSTDEVVWFSYPNPLDQYSGLAPMAAARLAADTATAAMKSNRNIFANGSRIGGVIAPTENGMFTREQALELQKKFRDELRGESKAHLTAVLAYPVNYQQWMMSPKDAEFLGALNWTLEEIARAFGVPVDLLGGSGRTFQNVENSRFEFWADTITAEARFIANTITERILPMFGATVDLAEFDFDNVDALRENEDAKWSREREQIAAGAITINEWRTDQGLTAVPWGDAWWAPVNLLPVRDNGEPPEPAPPSIVEGEVETEETPERAILATRDLVRQLARGGAPYGSERHQEVCRAFVAATEPYERRFARLVAELFRRQRAAVLAKAKNETPEALADEPFDMARWIATFQRESRPFFSDMAKAIGAAALALLALDTEFDPDDPEIVRAIERQSQHFARQVNETTSTQLRDGIVGVIAGGATAVLVDKVVRDVMGSRIASDTPTIARTEVTGAANSDTVLAWQQSGVVEGKRWVTQLDERVRETHSNAHGQEVAIDEDFQVGGGSGPGPGEISVAEENYNCRCFVEPVMIKR